MKLTDVFNVNSGLGLDEPDDTTDIDTPSTAPELKPIPVDKAGPPITHETIEKMSIAARIEAFEKGKDHLSNRDSVELFSELVKTGQAFELGGKTERIANRLIYAGILNESGEVDWVKFEEEEQAANEREKELREQRSHWKSMSEYAEDV